MDTPSRRLVTAALGMRGRNSCLKSRQRMAKPRTNSAPRPLATTSSHGERVARAVRPVARERPSHAPYSVTIWRRSRQRSAKRCSERARVAAGVGTDVGAEAGTGVDADVAAQIGADVAAQVAA